MQRALLIPRGRSGGWALGAGLALLGACGASRKPDPQQIATIDEAPEGFAFTAEGTLWVVRREAPDRLGLESYAPPEYQKGQSFSLGPDPDLATSALDATGGHVHLDVVASQDRLALLYSQIDAPSRTLPKGRLLLFALGEAPKKTAAISFEERGVGLGAAPDLSKIFLATSRGITTYDPSGAVLGKITRGLDNELSPGLFGAVSFDARGERVAHWLPTDDPQLSPPALQVIDLATGENVGPVKAADDPRPALSPDGRLLAYRVANDVDIFDVDAGKRISILQGAARQGIRSLQFLPGSGVLLVDLPDYFAVFYDTEPVGLSWRRGAELARLPAKDLVDFTVSPRGDVIAARSSDGKRLTLFRIQ
jgi:hypothetical protein